MTQKSPGSFEVTKIEATLAGTVARVAKELHLTTASGAKYILVNAGAKKCCDEEKKDVVAKIDALLKENKNSIKVTGVVSECCEGKLTLALSAAECAECKKTGN